MTMKKRPPAGSTANIALFYKNVCYICNAGDSRATLCENN